MHPIHRARRCQHLAAMAACALLVALAEDGVKPLILKDKAATAAAAST